MPFSFRGLCLLVQICFLGIGSLRCLAQQSVRPATGPAASQPATQPSGAGPSVSPAISADGRYIAFESGASNLVEGDANNCADVFVHDRQARRIARVSVSSGGVEGDALSVAAAISADGRFVAFASDATNLVATDGNAARDIFVHDRHTGKTRRVSVDSQGREADGPSSSPSISADGRYVAFQSMAANLVPGDANKAADVFVYDGKTGRMERISVDARGGEAALASMDPRISAEGRYVVFVSVAALVEDDTNGQPDVFVRDRQLGKTVRISVASTGTQANASSACPSISPDGRHVSFDSWADNLVPGDTNNRVDVFLRDCGTGQTLRVSAGPDSASGDNDSRISSVSAGAEYVAFSSLASNLVPGDSNDAFDVFVYERATGRVARLTQTTGGEPCKKDSATPAIVADGRFVVFASQCAGLVAGPTGKEPDIYLHDRQTGVNVRVSEPRVKNP